MSSTTKTTDNSSVQLKLAIVDRLQRLAVVHQAMEMAENSYSKIKHLNPLVDSTLTQAEQIVTNQLAKPVLTTFAPQIHSIDHLACQSFDRLESSVKMVTENPVISMAQKRFQETISMVQTNAKQARTMIMDSVEQVRGQIDSLRKQSTEHVHSVMNISEHLIRSVDNSLNAAESVLDRLLPPLNGSNQTDNTESISNQKDQPAIRRLYQRMVRFSEKIRRRIGQYVQEKWLMTILDSAINFRNTIKQLSSSIQINIEQAGKKPDATKAKQS